MKSSTDMLMSLSSMNPFRLWLPQRKRHMAFRLLPEAAKGWPDEAAKGWPDELALSSFFAFTSLGGDSETFLFGAIV